MLSKIKDSVTNTVKGAIDVLTPDLKEGKADKAEKKTKKNAKEQAVKKETKKPVKTTKTTSQAKPSVKAEKKEKGVLSKFTDAVKVTIDVLTPDLKEAKKPEKKAEAKVAKKKTLPAKSVNEMDAKAGEKQAAPGESNSLIDSFKKLAGGDDKAEVK